jgi:hypothetical protein
MELSWADLVVAVLERKVIPPDIPVDAQIKDVTDEYMREFRTANDDYLRASVIQFRGEDGRIDDSSWRLYIKPGAPGADNTEQGSRTPYGLSITREGLEQSYGPYEVRPNGSAIPLPPEAIEAVLSTVVTMAPIGEPVPFVDYLRQQVQDGFPSQEPPNSA